MTRGARLVDANNMVQDTKQFRLAWNDTIYAVAYGFIAHDQMLCQFWPPEVDIIDPIIMTSDAAESYDIKAPSEGQPQAKCDYDARTGRLILSSPTGDVYENVLAPVPRGTGVYLCKFEPTAGSFVTHFGDTDWHDVFADGSLGLFHNYLPNTSAYPGQATGTAEFSIAEDSGGGVPDMGTVVTKEITFIAERTGNNFVFTQAPWTLSDVKVNETASVVVKVGPDPYMRGYEGGSNVISERYAASWNSQFKVKVTVISGALTLGTEDTYLPLNSFQQWQVIAYPGESNDAVIDVTITDGATEITKRVTITATSTDESAASTLSDEFTGYNNIIIQDSIDGGQPLTLYAAIQARSDGTVNANTDLFEDPDSYPEFPQDWNTGAPAVPDPENFECRVTVVAGDTPTYGTVNVWLNLSSDREWKNEATADSGPGTGIVTDTVAGDYLLEIREVGRPDTVKSKSFKLRASALSYPPGIILP